MQRTSWRSPYRTRERAATRLRSWNRRRGSSASSASANESKPGGGTTVTLGMRLGPARTGVNPTANGLKKNGALAEPVPLHGGGPSAPGRSSPVRVLLVDDHAMVRQGLRSVLDGYADLDVIAEAGDGEEAVNLAHLLGPDVIVMDVNLPRLDGIEATKRILLARP